MSLDTLTEPTDRLAKARAAKAAKRAAVASPEPAPFNLYEAVPPPKMVAVKLSKNYRPQELPDPNAKGKFLPPVFEIVGHTQPAILKKNAAGIMETVQEEKFIAGEPAPPPPNGTLSDTKLWAGTVARFTVAEAKAMRKAGIGEYEIDDAD